VNKAVKVKGLVKFFPEKRSLFQNFGRSANKNDSPKGIYALKGLNLTVGVNQIFGLLGPNGAGKTTLIKTLNCLIPPTRGSVEVLGMDLSKDRENILSKVGYMPEIPSFYSGVTTEKIVEYYSKLYGYQGEEGSQRVDTVLEMVDMEANRKKKTDDLSFGMKKRLSLAVSVINDPELLILDEPTGGLDPKGKKDFQEMIRELCTRGRTVIMSSHILPEVQQMCSHAGIILKGKLISSGSMSSLQKTMLGGETVKIRIRISGEGESPREDISALEGVKRLEMVDEELIIFALDGELSVKVNEILANKGWKVSSLVIEEPELEDIFMHHTEGRSRKG